MKQERLPAMPDISARHDYLERLVQQRPEWAGRLMDGGQMTWLEWWFEIDCIQFPVAAQRLFGHWWRP